MKTDEDENKSPKKKQWIYPQSWIQQINIKWSSVEMN